jgi:DNA-binding response OmpR family regulator
MNHEEQIVLLAEDDPADAHFVQRAFGKAAIPSRLVRLFNGDDVVHYLDGKGPYENRANYRLPCLLLLDLKLPRRSGLEVLRWVRSRSDQLRLLPIIMLTSSRNRVDVNRAYEYGVNSYISKPNSQQELADLFLALKSYWMRFNEFPGT